MFIFVVEKALGRDNFCEAEPSGAVLLLHGAMVSPVEARLRGHASVRMLIQSFRYGFVLVYVMTVHERF